MRDYGDGEVKNAVTGWGGGEGPQKQRRWGGHARAGSLQECSWDPHPGRELLRERGVTVSEAGLSPQSRQNTQNLGE